MLSASPGGFVYVIINHFDCVATLYSVNTHDMWSITCVYKECNLIYRYIVLVTYVRVTRDRRWTVSTCKNQSCKPNKSRDPWHCEQWLGCEASHLVEQVSMVDRPPKPYVTSHFPSNFVVHYSQRCLTLDIVEV